MLISIIVSLILLGLYCRLRGRRAYSANTIGFLHPSSGAGGGGERVLWIAVDQIQRADVEKGVVRDYVVFTNPYRHAGSTSSSHEQLLERIDEQFYIRLSRPVRCVFLREGVTRYLDGGMYPRLTLLLQTVVGGALLFIEAAVLHPMTPLVMETVGVPMTYPLLRLLAGSSVVSYTHYPVVSSAMQERVWAGDDALVSGHHAKRGPLYRLLKYSYYRAFALLYMTLGQFPVLVFTNSSWTQAHIRRLFWPRTSIRLYAPCDVAALSAASKGPALRSSDIVSVGQFRPEKNHPLQLRAFHQAMPRLPADARLVLVGGARNAEDAARVQALVDEAASLGISERVVFCVNATYAEVHERLCSCCIGLHTMRDEHLGIVVLEYLAAGCIPLAHRSGGVELDIVSSPDLGFLAQTQEEYATAMVEICEMRIGNLDKYAAFQRAGSQHVRRFSDEQFGSELLKHMYHLLY